jgi:hypothetical protein
VIVLKGLFVGNCNISLHTNSQATIYDLDNPKMEDGLKETVYFDLLRLKNKRDYYGQIQNEYVDRSGMLEQRWEKLKVA